MQGLGTILITLVLVLYSETGAAIPVNGTCANRYCTVKGVRDFCPRRNYDCCEGKYENLVIKIVSNDKCCFDSINPVYNKKTHLCNGTTVIPMSKDLQQCGPRLVYRRLSEVCKIVIGNPLRFYVQPKIVNSLALPPRQPPVVSQTVPPVVHPKTVQPGCNGEDVLCNHNMKPVRKSHPDDNEICGNRTFNTRIQICAVGNVVEDIQQGQLPCGNSQMNSNDLCCDGAVYSNASGTLKCCEAATYDPMTQDCCSNGPQPKGIDKCSDKERQLKHANAYILKVEKTWYRSRKGTNDCMIKGPLMLPESSNDLYPGPPTLLYPRMKITVKNCPDYFTMLNAWYLFVTDKQLKKRTTLRTNKDWMIYKVLPRKLQNTYQNFYVQEKRDRQAKKKKSILNQRVQESMLN